MAKYKFGNSNGGSAKSRAALFFFAVVLITGLLIGYIVYKRHTGLQATAGLAGTPSIQSIPGVGKTSSEYVRLQEQQNIQQAQQAQQQGTASVPTITRTSYFGPNQFQTMAPGRPGCNPDELRRARAAGVTAEELRCKGCSLAELRAAGYTAGELAAAGYSATDLKNAGFTPDQLRQAGFTAAELKAAGFTPQQLAAAGYTPNDLSNAGFSARDIANAGFNPQVLAGAGFGTTPSPNVPKDCSPAALQKAHAQGVPATDLRKLGCGAAALRAAGYTAAELKAAGFSPEELKAAGYSAADLRAAGFTAGQLRRAGFTAADLKNAGFSPADLKNAGFSATDLKNAGFSPNDLRAAGYTTGDLLRAGFNPADVVAGGPAAGAAALQGPANCSIDALRQARAQGVSASDLRSRGCSAAAMLAAGYTPAELKAAGFSDDDLRAAGLTPAQIAAANAGLANQCNVDVLRQARARGVSAADLRRRGCGVAALLAAGYTPAELKAAGFSNAELQAGGVTPDQLASVAGIAGAATIPSVGNSEIQLAQLQANQNQQLNAQARDQRLTAVQGSMATQANSLFNTWTPPAIQQYVPGEPPPPIQTQTTNAASTTTSNNTTITGGAAAITTKTSSTTVTSTGEQATVAAGNTGVNQECADVKAGDIMMGVLTSTVNSDENSPVMARVVSGKLRGATLIGAFTLLKNKVLINFNKMNMPGKPASIGINAVAIDPQTAHTALADCVNNHYWLRYGTLFASSFLSGLADAISQQGSQTSTGAGGILVTHDPLSTGQTLAVALGAVGSQYASVLGSNFTRPPTVHVYDGDSIGLLFMQDLTVPSGCCNDVDKTCNGVGGGSSCAAHY